MVRGRVGIYRKIKPKLDDWRRAKNRKSLILKGARQVGKTYILREWAAESFKLLMHDVGLLGCAQKLEPAALIRQDYGTAKGYFAENLVAQEMKASHDTSDWPLYSWNEGTAEIEFVRSFGAQVLAIEAKAGHRTKAKSLAQFFQKTRPS